MLPAPLCKTSCSFRLCFHLRVPAGKHLSSRHYKSTMPISVSSGISSSLALARIFQSHHLSFSRSFHFSSKSTQSLFVACITIGWLPLTNVLRIYEIIYSQLASPKIDFGNGMAISVMPKPTLPDCPQSARHNKCCYSYHILDFRKVLRTISPVLVRPSALRNSLTFGARFIRFISRVFAPFNFFIMPIYHVITKNISKLTLVYLTRK